MEKIFGIESLPIKEGLNLSVFMDELLDASVNLAVYKEKFQNCKVDLRCLLPTLQKDEVRASSIIDGIQKNKTDDKIIDNDLKNQNTDLDNIAHGYDVMFYSKDFLKISPFNNYFFFSIHDLFVYGGPIPEVRTKNYRSSQVYSGIYDSKFSNEYTACPDAAIVTDLMNNLINYMNQPIKQSYYLLIQAAVIQGQFELIQPFNEENGHIGRILIPLMLYSNGIIKDPILYISDAIEKEKDRYNELLKGILINGDWSNWIKFMLSTVSSQCNKYSNLVEKVNCLYESHIEKIHSLNLPIQTEKILKSFYKNPIMTANKVSEETKIPITSVNRYLANLVDNHFLITDNKERYRSYYCFELLKIIRI